MSTCTVDGCPSARVARGLCNKHYKRARSGGLPLAPRPGPEERFWSKVNRGPNCWLWGDVLASNGYGYLYVDEKKVLAHRFSYELARGPVDEGLVLDHLCRTTACVNPDHLEAVPQRINILRGESPIAQQARQTHCKRNHEFTPENTMRDSRGKRRCRTCANAWQRARSAA